jgi:hypothetical protein
MSEGRGKQSAAASAAEKVRAMLEAAEQSAAALRAEAAEEIDAQLERAQGVAARLTEHANEIERSMQGLADSLRAELSALKADLEELRAVGEGVQEKRVAAAAPEPNSERPPQPPTEPRPEPRPVPPAEPPPEPAPPEPAAAEPAAPPAAEAAPAAAPPAGDGHEGARVIALNMALNGSPRDETARYLSENFELDDPEALLDEVYARVGS